MLEPTGLNIASYLVGGLSVLILLVWALYGATGAFNRYGQSHSLTKGKQDE